MAAQPRDKQGRPVRFIRVNGRVVPVRKDGGADMRRSYKDAKMNRSEWRGVVKEAQSKTRVSRKMMARGRAEGAVAGGVVGGLFGAAAGGLAGIASRAILKRGGGSKGALIGAAIGAAGLGIASAADDPRRSMMSTRQYNKALGKRIAQKYKGNKTGV